MNFIYEYAYIVSSRSPLTLVHCMPDQKLQLYVDKWENFAVY